MLQYLHTFFDHASRLLGIVEEHLPDKYQNLETLECLETCIARVIEVNKDNDEYRPREFRPQLADSYFLTDESGKRYNRHE